TVTGVYRDLVATRPGALQGFRATTTFLDVGTPRDYCAAARRLAEAAPNVIESGAMVAPAARLTRTVVWPDAAVEAGATLEDCIAPGGVQAPPHFRCTGAVLIPAAVARPHEQRDRSGHIAMVPIV